MNIRWIATGALTGFFSTNVLAAPLSSLRLEPVPITKETTIGTYLGKGSGGDELIVYQTPPGGSPGPENSGIGLLHDGQIRPMAILPQSRFYREYQGGIWKETPSRWSQDRRFAIFESEERLAIVDTQAAVILLNNTFTAFSKSPAEDRWAAIRYRPTGRRQEQLRGEERDTIWMIEANDLAANVQLSTSENPFAHLVSFPLAGIAVARPIWAEDGSGVAIVKHLDGNVAVDVLEPERGKLARSIPLPELELTKEEALSPWILPDVEQRATEALKAKMEIVFPNRPQRPNSVNQPRQPLPRLPETPGSEGSRSPTNTASEPDFPAAIIVGIFLGVGILGTIWFLLKQRSTSGRAK